MNSNKTPTCPCIYENSISHCLASYQSCWGLGWGRCGAYSGPVQHQKATGQTGWGCCWPLAVLGPEGAETPNCSGWGWKAGWGTTKFAAAAAAAAGMLWLVDYHCPAGWGGIEEDIWLGCYLENSVTNGSHTKRYFLGICHINWTKQMAGDTQDTHTHTH